MYRNYFVFNLTFIADITSARLRILQPGNVDLNSDPSETYVLYDVQTPAGLLGQVESASIFDDLGTGTVFGSVEVATPLSSPPRFIDIDLNADALAAMQGSRLFGIGGAIITLRTPPFGTGGDHLFGSSGDVAIQLILEGRQVPIPEPATLLLLGPGLAGVAAVVRRRRRAEP